MTGEELQHHFAGTYRNLRKSMVILGLVFPLFLLLLGWFWHGVPPQDSISAYYLAESGGPGAIPTFLKQFNIGFINDFLAQFDPRTPMRSWFVGFLFVLGIVMIVYQGLTPKENWLLNFAGLFALGVAIFPTGGCADCGWLTLHGVSAGASFLCLAAVAGVGALTVLREDLDDTKRRFYQTLYWIAAGAMVASPAVAWLVTQLVGATYFVFWAEAFGLGSFAAYWGVKSRELAETKAEKLAMEKKLVTEPAPVMARFPRVQVEKLVSVANS
jgi:hypothetical protein